MATHESLYWIGVRESELSGIPDMFAGSITVFGSNSQNNYAFDKQYGYRYNCNEDCDEWYIFVDKCVADITATDPECRFLLYYTADYPYYSEKTRERIVYISEYENIELCENKTRTRQWLMSKIPLPPFTILQGSCVVYEKQIESFPGFTEFVVQAGSSCSGNGTYLFNNETRERVGALLSQNDTYTVSTYLKNSVSLNIHLAVYEQEVVLFPPSVQIIAIKSDKFTYGGADFVAYKHLPESIQEKVSTYAEIIGKLLSQVGYRGVCGIDFIATKDEVYFMEINARFQSSTALINRAYRIRGFNTSMQAFHIDAFLNKRRTCELPSCDIELSFITYDYSPDNRHELMQFHQLFGNTAIDCECVDDELNWSMKLMPKAYLFGVFFSRSITAITPDFACVVNANLNINSALFCPVNATDSLLALKVMLLNHGVRIEQTAQLFLKSNGGVNFEEFEAVDMVIWDLYINAPYETKTAQLSPFEITLERNDKFALRYWGEFVAEVKLRGVDPIGLIELQNGIKANEIVYLGNDRLRVYHRNGCFYKDEKTDCRFCDVVPQSDSFTTELIMEAIDLYVGHPRVRHYMIGGGSARPESDYGKILEIARYLKKRTNKPIYLMTTPPADLDLLRKVHEAGITEVAFNVEVFDRDLAHIYMPGKSNITIDQYAQTFIEAVKLWGNTGNVRTAFIVGLESEESLLKGIEFVCRLGVAPMLSLFKPIEGTPLSYLMPPSDEDIYRICLNTTAICKKYGLELGPACKYCEDNMLKVHTMLYQK